MPEPENQRQLRRSGGSRTAREEREKFAATILLAEPNTPVGSNFSGRNNGERAVYAASECPCSLAG